MSDGVKHYGHDEGAWFWGCAACNPIEDGSSFGDTGKKFPVQKPVPHEMDLLPEINSLDVGSFGRGSGGTLILPAGFGGERVDWLCTVCRAGMTSWHATPLKSCGHCGQSESPLVKVVVAEPEYCPYDCDGCHDETCPCERMGCAGSESPGVK